MIRVASFLDDLRALRTAAIEKYRAAPNVLDSVVSDELIVSPMIIRARARMRQGRGRAPSLQVSFEMRTTHQDRFRRVGFNDLRFRARQMGLQL